MTYTKEILKTLHMFPSHYLLPQVTKINVTDLGIQRCLPTAGHYTPYQHTRSGRRVFIKLCNTARSIVTNISSQSFTTPKQSKPNFNNLHTVPIEHKDPPGTDDNKVHLSLVNMRSLPSKGEELKYYITEKAINICPITETWIHKEALEESLKVVTPEGYVTSSKTHLDGNRGGGIELIYNKESVTLSDTSTFEFREAECSLFKVRVDHIQLDLCVLYHYPEGNVFAFFEDLSNVLVRIVISSHKLVILGDFNIRTDLQDTVLRSNNIQRLFEPLQSEKNM